MQKYSPIKRQNPVLVEILITLLFFAACACLLVGVFATAYNKSESSLAEQEALLYAQNIAECFKTSDLDCGEYFTNEGWTYTSDTYTYSQQFSKTMIVFTVIPVQIDGIRGYTITASNKDESVFSFNVEVWNGK